MQQPTLVNVCVSSTRDALQIFYAVARRRRAIGPGNVYIWEERCANAEVTGLGMERWSDGRISWSASRIAQEFLFYCQRDTDPESSHRRDPRTGGNTSPRSEVDRLIKQTFSVSSSWCDVSVPPGWLKNARASKGRAGKRPRKKALPAGLILDRRQKSPQTVQRTSQATYEAPSTSAGQGGPHPQAHTTY
ncbi:hypothetical protein BC835DRAFT_1534402 [Cytidiella melzeri]|nr:hypothetical protein BC835DRAFT_1534402 [Cytidiella melzeri]